MQEQVILNAHTAANQFMEDITDQEAAGVKQMTKQAALNDYYSMRQSKIPQAANEGLIEAEQEALNQTQKLFQLMRTNLAQKGLETQHQYPIPTLVASLNLETLCLNTDLDDEMKRLADSSGAILIQAVEDSEAGY